VSLEGLQNVVKDPRALRLMALGFGNGGLFAILGWCQVNPYGWCRVFATDPKRAVVLERKSGPVIVTPDRPDEFVQEAKQWVTQD
ncbi:MAG TPA: PH domain-containing protein, partial [Thermoanaerobaculia bacterium]|nr:PH domain-containing protein [Thermoanaerobaculia bacterium]